MYGSCEDNPGYNEELECDEIPPDDSEDTQTPPSESEVDAYRRWLVAYNESKSPRALTPEESYNVELDRR